VRTRRLQLSESPLNLHLWSERTPENTQIVGVWWEDIQDISNWNEEAEVAPARRLYSIGYLLYEGPDPKDTERDMTVIAKTYNYEDGKWADFTCFPSVVIREIKPLTRKPRAKVK